MAEINPTKRMRRARRRVPALAMACLAATGLAVTRAEPAEPPDAPAAHASTEHPFTLGVSLQGRYDDNILQLSDRDLQRFEDDPSSDRFIIESTDDVIAELEVDLKWKASIFPRRLTRLGLSADANRYVENDVKDYEEYTASVSQELTASRRHLGSLRLAATRTPHFYLRQLKDDDRSATLGRTVRDEAVYAQDEYGVSYVQEIVRERLEGSLGWSARVRDYDAHFDSRDGTDEFWSLGLSARPFGDSKIALRVFYETGSLEAEGDLRRTAVEDDDVSFDHDTLGLEVGFPWGETHRGRLELQAERETRDYTTDNSTDSSHFGRDDDRRDYRLHLTQGLGPHLDLSLDLRRRSNDAEFPAGAASSDEVTDYEEYRAGLGLVWRLDF
ncbi:MAG TPA: hypothetical protein VFG76_02600 [Candidatus Polarisedimenticolia bacterium]|nr:hypothetical protein [Candidatus Polarisedimenticolia bacterium]